jgi:hypothetical protein
MKGLNILYVAAWRIFSNLGVAFRLSAPWLVVSIILLAIIAVGFNRFGWLFMLLGLPFWLLVSIFTMSCIAVGWHRFSLLGEVPKGWFYLPVDGALKAYIITVLKYSLVIFVLTLGIYFITFVLTAIIVLASQVEQPPQLPLLVVEFVLNVIFGALFAGLALVLPAAALRENFSIGSAFSATMDNLGTLFVLSFSYNLLVLIYQFALLNVGYMQTPGLIDFGFVTVIAFVAISTWFFFMFGIGYISELYGKLVMDEAAEVQAEPST